MAVRQRAMEALIYQVKALLKANGELSSFWQGNLRNRALDGEELARSGAEE